MEAVEQAPRDFKIHFEVGDVEAGELVKQAAARSLTLVRDVWELPAPGDLHIYVMSSWQGFLKDSAPSGWKILLALSRPLWQRRIEQTWAVAGGWEQRYGRRVAVGIKPPRLLAQADKRLGERIFVTESNLNTKMETIACHELTHACSTHLRLPAWLKEGLAMFMVDRYLGRPSVRSETLDFLRNSPTPNPLGGRGNPRITDEAGLLYLYAHGYWLVRWLEENCPGLLRDQLAQPQRGSWDDRLAAALGMEAENFHKKMDEKVINRYG